MIISPVVKYSPDKFKKLVHISIDHKNLKALELAEGESASQHCLKEADLKRWINEQWRFQLETLIYLSAK